MVSLTRSLAPTGFKSSKPKIKSSKNLSIANATALTEKMSLVFSQIQDPPVERSRVHFLKDILIIGILSVIARGKGWEDMENYGLSKYEWLEQFLALPEGSQVQIPFHGCLNPLTQKYLSDAFDIG